MKMVKTVSSTRSVRSIQSRLSSLQNTFNEQTLEFDTCLVSLFKKYGLRYTVNVKREEQQNEFYKSLKGGEAPVKYKKINVIVPGSNIASRVTSDTNTTERDAVITPTTDDIDSEVLTVTTIFDNMNRLVEILLNKMAIVPRELIQIMGYLFPSFSYLTKLKIFNCKIDATTVYELAKMLPLSSVTEVSLDGSVIVEGNYDILLNDGRLTNLSLSRCKINDEICKKIASKLHYTASAGTSLMALNLSSNHISDLGAKYLAEALRSNRCLRYLNLADNRIFDSGAGYILDTLTQFPLTCDEVSKRRWRYMEYAKRRLSVYLKYLHEIDLRHNDEVNQYSKKSNAKRKPTSSSQKSKLNSVKEKEIKKENATYPFSADYKMKAEMIAGEIVGPFRDPFHSNCIKVTDGINYCNGNIVLCYLNLSFNNVTYLTVTKILKVLTYQNATKMTGQTGLVKIVLHGNYIPIACPEYTSIDELLAKNLMSLGGKFSDFSVRRKSRTSRVSMLR